MTLSSWQQQVAQAARAYGTSSALLSAVNQREQGGTSNFVINDWDSNAAKGTPSGGPFQFIKPTFDAYARNAKKANPAAWRGVPVDWKNPYAQALAASWAMANGHGSAWSTYKKALADAGGHASGPSQTAAAPAQAGAAPAARPRLVPTVGGSSGVRERKRLGLILDPEKDQGFIDMMAKRWDKLDQKRAQFDATQAADPVAPAQSSGPATGGGAVPARRAGETGSQYLQRLGRSKFGLRNDPGNSQTTGGRHAANSYHYRGGGQAVDFGNALNSQAQLDAWKKWLEQNRQQLGIAELLNEGDHIHAATSRGIIGGKR